MEDDELPGGLDDAHRARWFDLLLAQLPAVLWTTDTELRFTSSLGAGLKHLGLQPGQVAGVTMYEYFQNDDATIKPIAESLRALAGNRGVYEFEWAGRTWQTQVDPLLDEAGECIGTIGIAVDITERKQAETQLRESRAQLRMFHDLLTHDMANVATTMQGLVERILATQADGRADPTLLERLRRQGFEITRLTENARLIAKLRAGRKRGASGRQRLRDVLGHAVRIVRLLHFDREFTLEIDCPDELHILNVPFPDHLLLNLLDNAVRHSPGRPPPRVDLVARRDDDHAVVIIHGGRPLSDEQLDRIFDRNVRDERSSGSGLGLSLVREIVEHAGGQIEASRDPEGARFSVTLVLPRG